MKKTLVLDQPGEKKEFVFSLEFRDEHLGPLNLYLELWDVKSRNQNDIEMKHVHAFDEKELDEMIGFLQTARTKIKELKL